MLPLVVGVAVLLTLSVSGVASAVVLLGDETDEATASSVVGGSLPPQTSAPTATPTTKPSRVTTAKPTRVTTPTKPTRTTTAKPTQVTTTTKPTRTTTTKPIQVTTPTKPTQAPTTEAPRPTAVQLVEPTTLNGRPKLTDPQFAGATKNMRESLLRVPGATTSLAALYGKPADGNMVLVGAAAAPIVDVDLVMAAVLGGAASSGATLTGADAVDEGPLGGTAQCGNGTASGMKVAMCVWVDTSSVGWIIWYGKSVAQVKKEFIKVRGQVEKVV